MKSRTTGQFRQQLGALPEEVQRQAKYAYKKFKSNPWHNSLHFKQVYPHQSIYSVRIARGYRAVGKRDTQGMLWFWIGSHADYDALLTRQ